MLTLTGCPMDDQAKQEYSISMTNLSNAQPISPPGALLHDDQFHAWTIGTSASDALEQMAEGGDASGVLALKSTNPQYLASTPLLPGQSTEFSLTEEKHTQDHLTIVGMLVNTNDGFTGLDGLDLGDMQPGDTRTVYASAYDAGTEANTELAGTIPGPADGGEGYNPARDDWTAQVTRHGGVVGNQDANPSSVLTGAEHFDNPVLRIEITAL
jgi:hypothetical protein